MRVILDVISAAMSKNQPLGLCEESAPSYGAFSMYGVDVMLTDTYKPVILEVNFSPDCTRACQVNIYLYASLTMILTHTLSPL